MPTGEGRPRLRPAAGYEVGTGGRAAGRSSGGTNVRSLRWGRTGIPRPHRRADAQRSWRPQRPQPPGRRSAFDESSGRLRQLATGRVRSRQGRDADHPCLSAPSVPAGSGTPVGGVAADLAADR
ncbi:hypothetical protein Jiend_42820 [Micromonospora endophytica]|nr:hypothetical protein Jiend_42820 [Micromonospora endophytica]